MANLRPFAALLTLLACLWNSPAEAHGINSHVHIAGWAVENLPPGPLATFFAEPEVFDALILGASFPDSGYAVSDEYGEMAHWAPFAEGCLADVRARYPLPWNTLEARKYAAFVMGLALHGLQDEIFDTLYLRQAEHHDGANQDNTDEGLDGVLFTAGHFRFSPELYVPAEALSQIFAQVHGHTVAPATIESGVSRVKLIIIDGFGGIGPQLDAEHRAELTWSIEHMLDPAVPGSFRSEISATMAYLEALWDKLHAGPVHRTPVAHTYPAPPRRLRSAVPDGVDHWISLILTGGVRAGALDGDRVQLLAPDSTAIAVRLRPSRWANSPDSTTRMVVVEPLVALEYDTEYRVKITPDLGFFDGAPHGPWSYTFRTPCAPGADCITADAGIPSIDPPRDMGPSTPVDLGLAMDVNAPDGRGTPPNTDRGVTRDAGTVSPENDDGCATTAGTPLDGDTDLLVLGLFLAGWRRRRRKGGR